MNKTILHYGTVALSFATALSAGVLALATNLPDSNFKRMGITIAVVLGAAGLGIKAFDAQISHDQLTAGSDSASSGVTVSQAPTDAQVDEATAGPQTGNAPSETPAQPA